MPEFILDHGSPEAASAYNALDDFTQGYIEAMFFTDANSDSNDLADATFAELAPLSLNMSIEECRDFQAKHRDDIDEAIDNGRINAYDEKAAGRDFWYTRNGHGVGFWDRDLGDVGETLTEAARQCGAIDLMRGDDDMIHLS